MTTQTRRPYAPLTTPISADQAEAEPSEARVFGEQPSVVPTTHAEISGFTWTIPLDITEPMLNKIIKLSKRMSELGFTPPRRQAWSGGKPQAKPATTPAYNDAGDPCCPIHTRFDGQHLPLKWWPPKDDLPGRWKCIAKAKDGEVANNAGYCGLRFDLPAPAEATNGKATR